MLKSEVQRRVRLPQADRKATVSEINTCYKQGMQKSFSECTAHRILMGYTSKRPPCVSSEQASEATEDGKKMLFGLIQMVDSEFGVNNIKTWLHPTLNQCFLYTGGGRMTHPSIFFCFSISGLRRDCSLLSFTFWLFYRRFFRANTFFNCTST